MSARRRSMGRRMSMAVASIAVAIMAISTTSAASAEPPPGDSTDLDGLPLTSVTAPGSAVGSGPDGEPWLYLVSSGIPAMFSVVDARDGSLVDSFELPDAGGSWAVTVAPNGDVYTGTYGNGHLFRWVPGSDSIEDLSIPVPGETFVWSVTSDAEGNIYGGTGQFGGHIFRYDPVTEEITDFGPISDGEEQVLVKSLTTSAEGLVYGLTAARPQLIELDPGTGEYRSLPLPPGASPTVGGYDLDIRGGLLFARFSESGPPSPLYVMDLETETWIQEIPAAHGLHLSELAEDGKTFYFVKDAELWSYNVEDRTYVSTGVGEMTDRRGFGFVDLGDPEWPGETLIALTYRGEYLMYSPETGRSEVRYAAAASTAASIRTIAEGPDGKVYAGGFLSGGLASYDPETGEKVGFAPEVGQTEGMTVHDGMLYIGTYPRGKILRLDPAEPVSANVNPELVAELYDEGQSRPYALASAGKYLAVGFAPINGRRGGGLALIDTKTGEYWFEQVVPGHSVIALTFLEGVLYGATSVYSGASGPRPDETDAVIFALDVETREMLWQSRPIPGERSFGDLAFDADGTLWTLSPLNLVGIDRENGSVVDTRSYGDYPWESIEYLHGAGKLWVDPYANEIITISQGIMHSADPETLERTQLERPVSQGFLHTNGTTYLARQTTFSSHRFRDERQSPTVRVSERTVAVGGQQTVELAGFGPGELVELWSQPEGVLIDTVNVDAEGSLRLDLSAPEQTGQARVVVTRAQTGSQIAAVYEVRSPEVTISHERIASPPLRKKGVTVRGTGFEPGATLTLWADGAPSATSVADSDGAGQLTYTSDDPATGTRLLTVSDGTLDVAVSLEVMGAGGRHCASGDAVKRRGPC